MSNFPFDFFGILKSHASGFVPEKEQTWPNFTARRLVCCGGGESRDPEACQLVKCGRFAGEFHASRYPNYRTTAP